MGIGRTDLRPATPRKPASALSGRRCRTRYCLRRQRVEGCHRTRRGIAAHRQLGVSGIRAEDRASGHADRRGRHLAGASSRVGLVPEKDVLFSLARDGLKGEIAYTGPVEAPVELGQKIADLVIVFLERSPSRCRSSPKRRSRRVASGCICAPPSAGSPPARSPRSEADGVQSIQGDVHHLRGDRRQRASPPRRGSWPNISAPGGTTS